LQTATLHTESTFLKRVHMWKGAESGLTKLSSFCHLLTPELSVNLVCPGKGKSFTRNINTNYSLFSLNLGANPININGTQLNKHRKEMRNGKGKGQGQGKGKEKGKEFEYSDINFQTWTLNTGLCLNTALGTNRAWRPWFSLAFQLVHSLHNHGNIAILVRCFMLISWESSTREDGETEAKLLGLRTGFRSPGWCFPPRTVHPWKTFI